MYAAVEASCHRPCKTQPPTENTKHPIDRTAMDRHAGIGADRKSVV
jgi:hypothetical protein